MTWKVRARMTLCVSPNFVDHKERIPQLKICRWDQKFPRELADLSVPISCVRWFTKTHESKRYTGGHFMSRSQFPLTGEKHNCVQKVRMSLLELSISQRKRYTWECWIKMAQGMWTISSRRWPLAQKSIRNINQSLKHDWKKCETSENVRRFGHLLSSDRLDASLLLAVRVN
jgi:hypothetical protein